MEYRVEIYFHSTDANEDTIESLIERISPLPYLRITSRDSPEEFAIELGNSHFAVLYEKSVEVNEEVRLFYELHQSDRFERDYIVSLDRRIVLESGDAEKVDTGLLTNMLADISSLLNGVLFYPDKQEFI